MLDSYERLILFLGFYFGKIWKNMEKQPFFWVAKAGLGNTTLATSAGLGSIDSMGIVEA